MESKMSNALSSRVASSRSRTMYPIRSAWYASCSHETPTPIYKITHQDSHVKLPNARLVMPRVCTAIPYLKLVFKHFRSAFSRKPSQRRAEHTNSQICKRHLSLPQSSAIHCQRVSRARAPGALVSLDEHFADAHAGTPWVARVGVMLLLLVVLMLRHRVSDTRQHWLSQNATTKSVSNM